MHIWVCSGQSVSGSKFLSTGQSSPPVEPSAQQVCQRQPSSPAPLLPSKKQSCHLSSLLSPGMPVAKLDSSLSIDPVHSGSSPSVRLSPSSSSQLLHS